MQVVMSCEYLTPTVIDLLSMWCMWRKELFLSAGTKNVFGGALLKIKISNLSQKIFILPFLKYATAEQCFMATQVDTIKRIFKVNVMAKTQF